MNRLKTKLKSLFHAQFARRVTILAAGAAIGQGIMLLAAPALTRLYSSADFGVLAVFTSALGILAVLATLRYEEAIPLPQKDEDAFSLLVLSFSILLIVSMLLGLGVWLAGDSTLALLKIAQLKPYAWLLPLALFGMSAYQILNYWAVRKAAFREIGVTKITQGLALAVTQIAIGLFHKTPLGLVLGDFAGRVAGSGMLFKVFRKSNLNLKQSLSHAAIQTQARAYWKFPAFTLPNTLLNTVSNSIPNLLLAALFDSTAAGHYFLALQVISAPMALLGKSVSQVFYQKASELHSNGLPLDNPVRQVLAKLFWIVVGPSLALMLFAPVLFAYVFGSEWHVAGEYLRYLIPWIATSHIVSPTACVITILNKQEIWLVFETIHLTARVLALLLGAHYSSNPIWAIAGFGAVSFIAHLVMLRLILTACRAHTSKIKLP